MNAITQTWAALSLQKRLVLIGAVVATLALTMLVARTATQPSMALLYGGLDDAAAGEVVTALEGMNVPVEVRGASIYVPASERDRARISLAEQGLPQQGQSGYELLDQLSGFGTTSEMFQAAYWRAKEGELARTIVSVPGVKSARVHIGAVARGPFQRAGAQRTASVKVTTSGAAIPERTALSIRYLVALAVPELEPSQVTVIDGRAGVVLMPGDDSVAVMADANAERRAQTLKQELESLLAVRFGPQNVRVSVSVETSKQTETIRERLIDPDSQVTVRSETEEVTERSVGRTAAVTVASNLPDGDAANAGGDNQSETEQIRETLSYRYSETERDQIVEAGQVTKIGVAVLVNEAAEAGADGQTTWTPRTTEELTAVEDLVKSAMGYDADRGDVVTVESMRFAADPDVGELAEASALDRYVEDNLGSLVQMGVLALVVIALGLFVVRPILNAKPTPAIASASGAPELTAAAGGAAALEGSAAAMALGEDGTPQALPSGVAAAGVDALPQPTPDEEAAAIEEAEDALRSLSDTVMGRAEESSNLLKKWLSEPIPNSEAA